MSATGWIVVPNWHEFQHYKNRTPVWIKNYTELMADDAYLNLTLRQRGILHGIWLLMAQSRLVLGSSPARLGSMLGDDTVRARDLEALNHAGFIDIVASKPLANGYQDASLEVEKSRTLPSQRATRQNGTSPRRRGTNPRATGSNPRANGTNPRAQQAETFPCLDCTYQAPTAGDLRDHIELVHTLTPTPVDPDDISFR